ncbi:MAG: FecR domain-containing protein [Pseudomonadota bacterium]
MRTTLETGTAVGQDYGSGPHGRRLGRALLLASVALVPFGAQVGSATAAVTDEVVAGTTTAVTTTTRGTPPISPERLLEVGTDIVRYERVRTDADGRAHLLFRDRTALTVGPNSEVVLDEFVFDPDTSSGKIVLGAAEGVLRFVGGKLSRQGNLTIETPVAVVGIRGSSAILKVDPSGATEVIHVTGEATVSARGRPGEAQVLNRSGFATTVRNANVPPEPAYRVEPAQLAAAFRQFESTTPSGTTAEEGSQLPVGQVSAVNSDQPVEAETTATAVESSNAVRAVAATAETAETEAAQDDLEQTVVEEVVAALPVAALPGGDIGNIVLPGTEVPGVDVPDVALPGGELPEGGVTDPELPEVEVPGVEVPGVEVPNPENPGVDPGTPPRLVLANGRWFGTSDGTNGWNSNADPAFNATFETALIDDDFLGVALSNGGDVVLPYTTDAFFQFGSEGTTSPFGPVSSQPADGLPGSTGLSGLSFAASDDSYGFFQTYGTAGVDDGQLLFGGTPVDGEADLSGFDAFVIIPDHASGSSIPGLTGAQGGFIADAQGTPLYRTPNGPVSKLGYGTVAFDGTGPEQRSAIGGGVLRIDTTSGAPVVLGDARGFTRPSSTAPGVRLGGAVSSVPDGLGNHAFGTGEIDFFVLDGVDYTQNPVDFTSGLEARQRDASGEAPIVTAYDTKLPVVEASEDDLAVGVRTARTLQGYAAGGAENLNGSFGVVSNAVTDVTVVTDPSTDSLQVDFSLGSQPTGAFETTYDVSFGGITDTPERGVFVDDRRWVARDRASSVDGVAQTQDRAIVFTNAMSPVTELPGGVEPCPCPFLEWGWWAAAYEGPDDAGPNSDLLVPVGTFVAGDLPTVAEIPLDGVASYSGHAIAQIATGGAAYTAAGTFDNVFDFGARSGRTTIAGLDGRTFAGAVASENGRDYASTAPFVADGVGLDLQGSFFRGGGDPVAATGGAIRLFSVDEGLDYSGAGTFAASRVPLASQ